MFTFFCRDGKSHVSEGLEPVDAYSMLGISITKIDFFVKGDRRQCYDWNEVRWEHKAATERPITSSGGR